MTVNLIWIERSKSDKLIGFDTVIAKTNKSSEDEHYKFGS